VIGTLGSSRSSWGSDLIAACWGLWGLVWLAGAVYGARHSPAVARRGLPSTMWLGVIVVAWLVLRALPAGDWSALTVHAGWLRALGAVVLVGSTAFTLWARVVLGRMWSSAAVIRDAHELRTTGPYAVTRHPIYTGMLGMLLGSVVVAGLGRWTAVFLLGAVLVLVKARAEERLLADAFGARYAAYRVHTAMLVPGVRLGRRRRKGHSGAGDGAGDRPGSSS